MSISHEAVHKMPIEMNRAMGLCAAAAPAGGNSRRILGWCNNRVAFVGAALIMARAAFGVIVVIRKPKQPAARKRE
jgi:hypothetical protein